MEKTGLDIVVTGRAVEDVNTIDALVDGQVLSMLLAGMIIFGVIFLTLRSFSIGLLNFIPNLFPIVNFGSLSAVIMITAVIGDLILLPSLLCFFNEKNSTQLKC